MNGETIHLTAEYDFDKQHSCFQTMDMKMPIMDGRAATAEIQKFNTRIPIVALTAHAFEAERITALEVGCDDYLVKPINGAKLI